MITMTPLTVAYVMVVMAWLSTFFFRKQLMMSLLSLEFMLLGLFMSLMMTMSIFSKPLSISFYLLVLGACEASLGLTLLVTMTRFTGSDMLSLISKTKY